MSHIKQKEKRSRLYVDPEVQKALARRVAMHWLLFIFVCFGLIGVLQSFVEHPSLSPSDMLTYAFKRNFVALVVSLAMMPMFIFDTVKLSNRFAGPVTRLRHKLRTIAQGEPTGELKMRSGDYWQDLAREFNAAVMKLQAPTAREVECGEDAVVELTS